MMIKSKQNFEISVHEIVDKLTQSARKNEFGIFWDSLRYDPVTEEYETILNEDIYSGNAGILLFLAEYYRQQPAKDVYNIISEGLRWLENYCEQTPSTSFALYTGRSGVAFLFLHFFKLFDDIHYLAVAEKLMDESWLHYKKSGMYICDLLNGAAGLLLGMLHLHAISKKENLLEKIHQLSADLLKQINFGKKGGIYWDRTIRNVSGLCGLSHGASGMAFVFAELANYLNSEELLMISEQAFLYEDSYFNMAERNWPDLRKATFQDTVSDEDLMAYRANDLAYFSTPRYMFAWCHGAPGIGLSRLRMYRLSGKEKYKIQADHALEGTIGAYRQEKNLLTRSFTLCHGIGGNFFLLYSFLQADHFSDGADMLEQIGSKAIQQINTKGKYVYGIRNPPEVDDLSLMNGLAGIGYFLLMCNEQTPPLNILLPTVNEKVAEKHIEFNTILPLYQQLFPRTMSLILHFLPSSHHKIITSREILNTENITEYMYATIAAYANNTDNDILKECFAYEWEIRKLDEESVADSYWPTHEKIIRDDLSRITIEKVDNVTVKLTQLCFIKHCRYPWNRIKDYTDFQQYEPDTYLLLLKQSAIGTKEQELDNLSQAILESAAHGAEVKQIINKIMEDFSLQPEHEKKMMIRLIRQQFLELLKSGILIITDHYVEY